MNMTQEQQDAARKIEEFLNSGEKEFVLSGYAGTGKTFTIGRVLARWDRLGGGGEKVVFVAPTHKAVGVLYSSIRESGITSEAKTIHSLLKCRKVRTGGRIEFLPDKKKQNLNSYDVIVVDEASMIGKERAWLLSAIEGRGIKIIWMGDPAQLPPVNDESVVFGLDCPGARLETIMRNGGVVQQAATNVRLHIADIDTRYAETQSDELGSIVRQDEDTFLNAYLERRQTAKLLAWRNEAVDWLNDWVREQIYDDSEEFHLGERLVVVSTFELRLTSSVARILKMKEPFWFLHSEYELDVRSEPELMQEVFGDAKLSYYRFAIDWISDQTGGEKHPVYVDVLARESKGVYKRLLEGMRAQAIKTKDWEAFYELSERFIEVRPGWATTVHKSQGSTYDEVFVVEADLRGCKDHLTRNMLTYVAYSRAKKELWIL